MFKYLADYVEIQEKSEQKTRSGVETTWTLKDMRWVALTQLDERSMAVFHRIGMPEANYQVIVRADMPLDYAKHRIVCGDIVLELLGPGLDKSHGYLSYAARRRYDQTG